MDLRVAIAEDDLLVREGLRALLSAQPGIEVVAACPDADALLAALDSDPPDVVLTDIRMPPTHTEEGIRLAAGLATTHPAVGVVVVSQHAEPSLARTLIASGSAGRAFLLKERVADVQTLVSAIQSVATGRSMFDPELLDALVSGDRPAAPGLDELTPREHQVLEQMARGGSNGAIGRELGLTERAVEKHVGAVFLKLGLKWETEVNRRVKAVLLYLAEIRPAPRP